MNATQLQAKMIWNLQHGVWALPSSAIAELCIDAEFIESQADYSAMSARLDTIESGYELFQTLKVGDTVVAPSGRVNTVTKTGTQWNGYEIVCLMSKDEKFAHFVRAHSFHGWSKV